MQNDTNELRHDFTPGAASDLAEKAARCRRLASTIADHQTASALLTLAEDYERDAARLAG